MALSLRKPTRPITPAGRPLAPTRDITSRSRPRYASGGSVGAPDVPAATMLRNPASYSQAQEMLASGMPAATVQAATGWLQDDDGKLTYSPVQQRAAPQQDEGTGMAAGGAVSDSMRNALMIAQRADRNGYAFGGTPQAPAASQMGAQEMRPINGSWSAPPDPTLQNALAIASRRGYAFGGMPTAPQNAPTWQNAQPSSMPHFGLGSWAPQTSAPTWQNSAPTSPSAVPAAPTSPAAPMNFVSPAGAPGSTFQNGWNRNSAPSPAWQNSASTGHSSFGQWGSPPPATVPQQPTLGSQPGGDMPGFSGFEFSGRSGFAFGGSLGTPFVAPPMPMMPTMPAAPNYAGRPHFDFGGMPLAYAGRPHFDDGGDTGGDHGGESGNTGGGGDPGAGGNSMGGGGDPGAGGVGGAVGGGDMGTSSGMSGGYGGFGFGTSVGTGEGISSNAMGSIGATNASASTGVGVGSASDGFSGGINSSAANSASSYGGMNGMGGATSSAEGGDMAAGSVSNPGTGGFSGTTQGGFSANAGLGSNGFGQGVGANGFGDGSGLSAGSIGSTDGFGGYSSDPSIGANTFGGLNASPSTSSPYGGLNVGAFGGFSGTSAPGDQSAFGSFGLNGPNIGGGELATARDGQAMAGTDNFDGSDPYSGVPGQIGMGIATASGLSPSLYGGGMNTAPAYSGGLFGSMPTTMAPSIANPAFGINGPNISTTGYNIGPDAPTNAIGAVSFSAQPFGAVSGYAEPGAMDPEVARALGLNPTFGGVPNTAPGAGQGYDQASNPASLGVNPGEQNTLAAPAAIDGYRSLTVPVGHVRGNGMTGDTTNPGLAPGNITGDQAGLSPQQAYAVEHQQMFSQAFPGVTPQGIQGLIANAQREAATVPVNGQAWNAKSNQGVPGSINPGGLGMNDAGAGLGSFGAMMDNRTRAAALARSMGITGNYGGYNTNAQQQALADQLAAVPASLPKQLAYAAQEIETNPQYAVTKRLLHDPNATPEQIAQALALNFEVAVPIAVARNLQLAHQQGANLASANAAPSVAPANATASVTSYSSPSYKGGYDVGSGLSGGDQSAPSDGQQTASAAANPDAEDPNHPGYTNDGTPLGGASVASTVSNPDAADPAHPGYTMDGTPLGGASPDDDPAAPNTAINPSYANLGFNLGAGLLGGPLGGLLAGVNMGSGLFGGPTVGSMANYAISHASPGSAPNPGGSNNGNAANPVAPAAYNPGSGGGDQTGSDTSTPDNGQAVIHRLLTHIANRKAAKEANEAASQGRGPIQPITMPTMPPTMPDSTLYNPMTDPAVLRALGYAA